MTSHHFITHGNHGDHVTAAFYVSHFKDARDDVLASDPRPPRYSTAGYLHTVQRQRSVSPLVREAVTSCDKNRQSLKIKKEWKSPERWSRLKKPEGSAVFVCEPTFQGILLRPHDVDERVLQRVHTEAVKGARSLLQNDMDT